MTDTTLTPNEPTPQEPKPLDPREQVDREHEAGKVVAEGNAELADKARDDREQQTMNAREWAARGEAANNKEAADRADEVKGMVDKNVPPPGPGMPKVDKTAIAATMDPNNPVLNPDMSKYGRDIGLPPGARTPAPVLPQDTIQTQFASKPPTEEHAKEGEEAAKGRDTFPPAGSQPALELTAEQQKKLEAERPKDRPADRPAEPAPATPPPPVSNPPKPGQNT